MYVCMCVCIVCMYVCVYIFMYVCIGMNLANLEGTLIIAFLVHYFDFQIACNLNEVKRIFNFTVIPSKMPVIFNNRNI